MKKVIYPPFSGRLKHIAATTWLIAAASIPVNLLAAGLLSGIVTSAIAGEIKAVCSNGFKLALLLIGYKLFESCYRIKLEQVQSKALNQCKMELYSRFLSSPLPILYAYNSGQVKERLHDDFDSVTEKILSVYPMFYTGVITVVVWHVSGIP